MALLERIPIVGSVGDTSITVCSVSVKPNKSIVYELLNCAAIRGEENNKSKKNR